MLLFQSIYTNAAVMRRIHRTETVIILGGAYMRYAIDFGKPGDIDSIARFQIEMAFETERCVLDPATVRKGVGRMFAERERGFYIVVRDEKGAAVSSLLVLKEWSDWRNTDVWWVHSVYVTPEHRRRGLFRRMFAHVEAMAAEQGIAGIRLYVEKENARAKAVYNSLGMNGRHYDLFEKMLRPDKFEES